jgi:arylsulfatase A-like enzyme
MGSRGIRRAALLLLLCTGVACSRGDAPTPSGSDSATSAAVDAPRPRIIVLVSIDTLRADHLGVYGHERFTSPVLDGLAAQGALFLDASAPAPWTLPSHVSMLTGLHPGMHGVRTQRTRVPDDLPTLAAWLEEAGWQTAAVVNSTWLNRDTLGVTRDFTHYEAVQAISDKRSPTTWVTDRTIEWIRELADRPLFVFAHYYDVHADYASMPDYERLFVTPYDGPADGTLWQLQIAKLEDEYVEMCHRDFNPEKCNFGSKDVPRWVDSSVERLRFDAADIRHLEELYDAGVRQMDAELGRFLRLLDDTGRAEETLLLVTSDHGEEFYDHGRVEHFLTQYQELLHVPLIVRGPGVPAGVRIETPVSLVDVAPTILAAAGIEAPPGLEGMDLAPLWRGEPDAPFVDRYLYGEAPGGLVWQDIAAGVAPVYRSVRKGRYKLVHEANHDTVALYDLASDPAEQHDVAVEHPEVVAELRAALEARTAAIGEAGSGPAAELDPEEAERLRALGYIVP